MASKIEKTIARQKQKISEGQYYEAHQHLRVITRRYLSSDPPNYTAAIDILFEGALSLLQAGQGAAAEEQESTQQDTPSQNDSTSASSKGSAGSGGDLCMYLMDVYHKSEMAVDAESRGRVLRLLRAFPKGEPTRKRFINEAVAWSAKFGEYPAGDPEIHHVAGQLLAADGDAYDAERHLLHGTRDSPSILANFEYSWYTQDTPDTAPLYCARAVLPYLLLGNLRAATQTHFLFTSKLPASLGSETISSDNGKLDARIYPSLPLMNFLALLLLAVQRGAGGKDTFSKLRAKYMPYLQDQADGCWNEALDLIGESWVGIRRPRPMGNPLMDMMGSMLGGGFGGGGSGGGGGPRPGRSPASRAPPALNVD